MLNNKQAKSEKPKRRNSENPLTLAWNIISFRGCTGNPNSSKLDEPYGMNETMRPLGTPAKSSCIHSSLSQLCIGQNLESPSRNLSELANYQPRTQRRVRIVENIEKQARKISEAMNCSQRECCPIDSIGLDLGVYLEQECGHNLFKHARDISQRPVLNTREKISVQVTINNCRGHLIKRGEKRNKWKKRWFFFDLKRHILFYYLVDFYNYRLNNPVNIAQ